MDVIRTHRLLLFACVAAGILKADDFAVPHVALGSGWSTDIWLYNSTVAAGNAVVSLFDENGRQTPINVIGFGGGPLVNIPLDAGATRLVSFEWGDRFNPASPLFQGWAKISASAGVYGLAIYKQAVPGRFNEATIPFSPLSGSQSRQLVYYNNGPGRATGVACINTSPSVAGDFSIQVYDEFGRDAGSESRSLAPGQHVAFNVWDKFALTRGTEGYLDLRLSGATTRISCIGLAFYGADGMTSVFPQ